MKGKHQVLILMSVSFVIGTVWMISIQDSPLINLRAASDAFDQVKRLQINEAYLVATDGTHFAVSTPELAKQTGWKIVSVNGNDVDAFTANCGTLNVSLESLSQQQRALLMDARQQLHQVDAGDINNLDPNCDNIRLVADDNQTRFCLCDWFKKWIGKSIGKLLGSGLKLNGREAQRYASIRYSLASGRARGISATNVDLSRFARQGADLIKLGKDAFSFTGLNLPTGVVLLFVDGDVATFVHQNGRVSAKPVECLGEPESQLIKQVREDLKVAEMEAQTDEEQQELERELKLREWEANWKERTEANLGRQTEDAA